MRRSSAPSRVALLALATLTTVALSACQPFEPVPLAPTAASSGTTEVPTATAPWTAEPPASSTVEAPPNGAPPQAIPYNLGEATILQTGLAEDSRFHAMPVRLDGLIAAPEDGGPHPVVVIIHGSHTGCPLDDSGEIDTWPCAPEQEQRNYLGFDYLVSELAARGYVALALNANAEYTLGYGEPMPGERLAQLVDQHLSALAAANSGQDVGFDVDLAGRVDLSQLAFIGHSQGGELASTLTRDLQLDQPAIAETRGFGPVAGILQVAPTLTYASSLPPPQVPLATILPACDGDVVSLDGQGYYESARLEPERQPGATTAYLARANHNYFNSILLPESRPPAERTDCNRLLSPEAQQAFLVQYAADYLSTLFGSSAEREEAASRLGVAAAEPAPGSLYGYDALISFLAPAANRLPLIVPADEVELDTSQQGGTVTWEAVDATYCGPGYYTPNVDPSALPCRRVNLVQPGYPAQVVMSWEDPDAALRLALPPSKGDLAGYDAISMRVVQDPLSDLNRQPEAQSFTLAITDATGASAQVVVPPETPALAYPQGLREENEFFEGGSFSGPVQLSTLRVPLSAFEGVDLSQVTEIALLLNQTPSGSLFLADLELVVAQDLSS